MKKSVLIISAHSSIGASLKSVLANDYAKDYEVISTSRYDDDDHYLNLNNEMSVWPDIKKVDVIVYLASLKNIQACEENKEKSKKIHCDKMQSVYEKYAKNNAQLIMISSQRIFQKNNMTSTPNEPECLYAKHKLMAEDFVNKKNGSILRLTKVLVEDDYRLRGFAAKLLKSETCIASDEVYASFVLMNSVIEAILLLIKKNARGIYQLSGKGQLSYYEAAKEIACQLGIDERLVLKQAVKKTALSKNSKIVSMIVSKFFIENGIEAEEASSCIDKWCRQLTMDNTEAC